MAQTHRAQQQGERERPGKKEQGASRKQRGTSTTRGIWVTEMRLDTQVPDCAALWGTGMDMGFYLGF